MTHNTLDYKQRIREQGYRLTPQRQIILDTICAMGQHATANDICDSVQTAQPAINRATVYRALNFFCDLRLLVTGEIDGKTVYEIAASTPHHHLVCRKCGHVGSFADHHLQPLIEHLVEEHHFQPEIDHLTIPGICAACQE